MICMDWSLPLAWSFALTCTIDLVIQYCPGRMRSSSNQQSDSVCHQLMKQLADTFLIA